MSGKENQDDTIRRLVLQLQSLESIVQDLSSRLGMLEARISEISVASSTLDSVKHFERGSEILVPIGGDTYVKANVEKTSEAIRSIGSNVFAEGSVDAAQNLLNDRSGEFQKLHDTLTKQLEQASSTMTAIRNRLQQFSQQSAEMK